LAAFDTIADETLVPNDNRFNTTDENNLASVYELISTYGMEAQVHPLVVTTPRFIQISMPLLPLKPMAQIEPSVLRAAKAASVE
jgi:hypothetical protein